MGLFIQSMRFIKTCHEERLTAVSAGLIFLLAKDNGKVTEVGEHIPEKKLCLSAPFLKIIQP